MKLIRKIPVGSRYATDIKKGDYWETEVVYRGKTIRRVDYAEEDGLVARYKLL